MDINVIVRKDGMEQGVTKILMNVQLILAKMELLVLMEITNTNVFVNLATQVKIVVKILMNVLAILVYMVYVQMVLTTTHALVNLDGLEKIAISI